MKMSVSDLSRYFSSVPDSLRQRKAAVWLFFAAVTVVLFIGMTQIHTDLTVESWFKKDDPSFVAYDNYHAQFGSEDALLVVYKPKDGNVFSAKSLETVRRIRDELYYHRSGLQDDAKSALDHIVRVNSLVNVPVLTAQGDVLVSRPLVGSSVPTSPEALEQIRRTAQSQENISLRYFSEDLKYGGMIIDTDFGAVPCDYDEAAARDMTIGDVTMAELTFDDSDAATQDHCFKPTDMRNYEALNAAVKAVLYQPEYASHFEYYLVGNTAESEYQKLQQQEMGQLYLLAIVIMIVLLWVLFRSFAAVAWAMLIVVLTTIWTMGISSFLGLTITPFIILTAFLLLTVSMADAVHLMSSYLFFRKQGCDHPLALRSAYGKASVACLLTSATTIIGIASLCFSEIVPVWQVGIMGSTGVAVAFFLTIYLLPMLLELWPPVRKQQQAAPRLPSRFLPNFQAALQKGLAKVVPAVQRRPVAYCVPFFVLLATCVYGLFHARVDSDLLSLYPEDSQFSQSVRLLDEKMAGSNQMSIFMDFGASRAAEDPFVLQAVDDLQTQFENKYRNYVVTTSSLVDIVKDTYQKLNQGSQDRYVVPEDQGELSQTLYLFNNADPEQRKRLVDDSYQKAAVTVTLRNAGTFEYGDVFDSMQQDIHESLSTIRQKYPQAQVSITGMFVLKMRLDHLLTMTGLRSFGAAFVVINILFLFVVFGSIKAGAIAIIPNIIPSILVVGAMGLLGIPLDFFAIILAPIIIGISVDDTTHFLTHYRMQYAHDRDIATALRNTMKEAGQGIVFTSLILGLGFGILALSFTPGVAKVGIFGGLAIFVGLANDLFLLPALITLFKLRSEPAAEEQPEGALTSTS
jgi:hypothetical protein